MYGLPAGVHNINDYVTFSNSCFVWALEDITNDGAMMGTARCGTSFQGIVLTPAGYTFPEPPRTPLTSSTFDSSGQVVDPINTFTGELVVDDAVDLLLSGPMPLAFTRSFGSHVEVNGLSGAMGTNWRHNFEMSISVNGNAATVAMDDGRRVAFSDSGSGWAQDGLGDIPFQLWADGNDLVFLDPRARPQLFRFDAQDRLVAVEDVQGNTHVLTYDQNGRLTDIADDGTGHSLMLTYDVDGRVQTVSDGARLVSYAYSPEGHLLAVTDVNGGVTNYQVSDGLIVTTELPRGNRPYTQTFSGTRVSSQTNAVSETTELAYNFGPMTQTTSITDPTGGVRVHVHTNEGVLTEVHDALGGTILIESDAQGRRTRITNPVGSTTEIAYDAATGEPSRHTHPDDTTVDFTYTNLMLGVASVPRVSQRAFSDGTNESFSYDVYGNLTSVTDRTGESFGFEYDARGQVAAVILPTNGRIELTYSSTGAPTGRTDPNGNVTAFGADGLGRPDRLTHPDGSTKSWTFAPDDQVVAITNERGGVTTFEYDSNGNLTLVADPGARTSSIAYDDMDRIERVTDGSGRVWAATYHSMGGIASVTNALGETRSFDYDERGLLVGATDPSGARWQMTTDAAGRLTAVTDPLGNTRRLAYDAAGRPVRFTAPDGAETTFVDSPDGHTRSLTNPLGETTTYRYDPRGDLIEVEADNGTTVSFTRDALRNVTTARDAIGSVWSQTFDAAGRPTGETDPLGNEWSFAYDSRNRITSVVLPNDGTINIEYDPTNNETRRTYSDGTTFDFTYDASGELTATNEVTFQYDEAGEVVGSNGITAERDLAGRIVELTLAPNKVVRYVYDSRGLVTTVTDWLGGTTSFTYDANGRVTSLTRPNGVVTTHTYDSSNRVTSIEDATSGGLVLGSVNLSRDVLGRVVSADREVPSVAGVTEGVETFSYDAASQLRDASYDVLGRTLGRGDWTYTWDLASRLTSATDATTTRTFEHDGLGRVIRAEVGGVSRNYVRNYVFAAGVISVVEEASQPVAFYVHAPDGSLLYQVDESAGARRYYHFDERGSTQFLTDEQGNVTDSYAYAPYGAVLASAGTTDQPFKFAGRYGVVDYGGGLYEMGLRFYDATVRRFLSREPMPGELMPEQLNPYLYALANPVRYLDILGTEPGDADKAFQDQTDAIASGVEVIDNLNWFSERASKLFNQNTQQTIDSLVGAALRNADGVPVPKTLQNIAYLQDRLHLEAAFKRVGSLFEELNKWGSALKRVFLIPLEFGRSLYRAKAEVNAQQDAANQLLQRFSDEVLDAIARKQITQREGMRLLRSIRWQVDRDINTASENYAIDLHIAFFTATKDLLTTLLPNEAQLVLDLIPFPEPQK